MHLREAVDGFLDGAYRFATHCRSGAYVYFYNGEDGLIDYLHKIV